MMFCLAVAAESKKRELFAKRGLVARKCPRQADWVSSVPKNPPPCLADPPICQLVSPLISELAGGLIFCINGNERFSLNIARVSDELCHLLSLLEAGRFREVNGFESLPGDLLLLKGVVLAGITHDAHCLDFSAMVKELIRVREMSRFPEFKIVLITDGKELDSPNIQLGLEQFLPSDEIWIQLNGASLPYQAKSEERGRRPGRSPLFSDEPSSGRKSGGLNDRDSIQQILLVASKRPVVIQSAFFALYGEAPTDSEIKNYIRLLKKLRRCGAQIASVQVCSPPPPEPKRGQLKLKTLSLIARRIRDDTGLPTEFY